MPLWPRREETRSRSAGAGASAVVRTRSLVDVPLMISLPDLTSELDLRDGAGASASAIALSTSSALVVGVRCHDYVSGDDTKRREKYRRAW